MLAERSDLSSPGSHAENQPEEQTLLPHERDQTTSAAGTSLPGDEQSREVIDQARKDTERGLKDTDRRGIPSDIVKSDTPAVNDISPGAPGGESKKKR